MPPAQQMSVRELIAELLTIEDAIRSTPTFVVDPGHIRPVNPQLMNLAAREEEVVTALRFWWDEARRPATPPVPGVSLPG